MDISRRLNDLPGQWQKGFSVILISKSCLGIFKTFPPETSKRVHLIMFASPKIWHYNEQQKIQFDSI